ncbi:MAG TPA: Ig-like domain-containing protein [Longimicrobiales bacterium]|nr:Ig-like domain-containing protein [Longimicrobiales bacterium]
MTAGALLLAAVLQQAPVTVTPAELTLEVDGRATLTARVLGADGAVDPDVAVRWSSLDEAVVVVDATGRVTAVAPGTARVAALTARGTAFTVVTVPELPPVRLLAALEGGNTVPAGGSAPLRWAGESRLGTALEVPSAVVTSSDPSVAALDAAGRRVFGVGPGQAVITVAAEGLETEVVVRVADTGVEPVLEPAQPRVRTGDVVRFRVGDGYRPGWSVAGAGAQITEEGEDGVFVAERPGRYEVVARVGRDQVQSTVVEVVDREYDAELVLVGRGAIPDYHSADTWVFEGIDGRDYMYVGTYLHDWMTAWDVTDPANPVRTDSLRFDARRINDIKIHPNNRLGIATREGASSRRNGIVLLDLSDPAHPAILSEYTETVSGGVHNVWIDGDNDVVYAAHNGTSSIHVLDISDPAAVREVGRWSIERQPRTLHDVIVQDGYLYASYWDDGILMLDVGAGSHGGTPTSPVEVSRFAYPIGNTHVAWRSGRYLFVGDEIFPEGWNADRPVHARGYIHVVDYVDPENPVEVARYEVPEAGVHNIWIEGDRMYLGYYQAGLRVVDISGELRGDLYAQGREVARILTTDEGTTVPNWPMAWGAQIHKGRIYSTDFNSGIWITQLRERRTVF